MLEEKGSLSMEYQMVDTERSGGSRKWRGFFKWLDCKERLHSFDGRVRDGAVYEEGFR
jgi:hypothetical protein